MSDAASRSKAPMMSGAKSVTDEELSALKAVQLKKDREKTSILRKMRHQMEQQLTTMQTLMGDAEDIEGAEELLEDQLVFGALVMKKNKEYMREIWPDVHNVLKGKGIIAELNLVEMNMKITSTALLRRAVDFLKAKDLLKLLARGFPWKQAQFILTDGWNCDFIKIGGSIATKEEFLKRRNRLIGPDGVTLKAVELLTGCFIFVHGNTVCVLGKGYDGINTAGEIILDCMKKVNPISHIRRLVILKELSKDKKIPEKDWARFLPPIRKNLEEVSDRNVRNIDFLKDSYSEMTYGRRLALELMQHEWYLPPYESDSESDEEIEDGKEALRNKGNNDEIKDTETIKSAKTEISTAPNSKDNDVKAPADESFQNEGHPVTKKQPPPNIRKGWAYFEHSILPRSLTPKTKPPSNIFMRFLTMSSQQFDVAEPGEFHKPTQLYSWIFTPLSQMGDFGIGIGLYFSTLRSVALLTLLATLINIPNLLYYQSEAYSPTKSSRPFDLIKSSAICLDSQWVPCPQCNVEHFSRAEHRLKPNAWVHDNLDCLDEKRRNPDSPRDCSFPQIKKFVMKNDCAVDRLFRLGMYNYVTIFFMYFCIMILNATSKKMEIQFDEDEQTAQDYSIMIDNPPEDAIDPDEWKHFFEKVSGGHVTVCTIAVDNDLLLRTLVLRRNVTNCLKDMLPVGTSLSETSLAGIAARCEAERTNIQNFLAKIGLRTDVSTLYNKNVVYTSKIRGLSQISYPATKVYITFETETAQRTALMNLSVGRLVVTKNKVDKMKKKHLFRGNLVLDISEPEEPSTVRWQDLNSTMLQRYRFLIVTFAITGLALVGCAIVVVIIRNSFAKAFFTTYTISGANVAFPLFAKLLTKLELHPSESSKQASLYVKIAFFRWVNTGIVIAIITPFTEYIMRGPSKLIPMIEKIFISEITTINLLQLMDVVSNFKRHFLAPRAKTELSMNKLFQGTSYELAERYTNMTKILFLSFVYCAIYPAGLFMAFFAISINYYTDAFSLMYSWTPAPKIGNSVANMSRKYFFSFAFIALTTSSAYMWAGFPFDNLCPDDNDYPEYAGFHNFTAKNSPDLGVEMPQNVTISNTTKFYKSCKQDFFFQLRKFPPLPDEGTGTWMTENQKLLVVIFSWTTVAFIAAISLRFVWEFIEYIIHLFKSDYEPSGKDMRMNYSTIDAISGYIPQIVDEKFLNPLIACDIDTFDDDLFDWADPDKGYEYYSLTKDTEEIIETSAKTKSVSLEHVFSKVKHWPPVSDENSQGLRSFV